jgi:hypothetical protein
MGAGTGTVTRIETVGCPDGTDAAAASKGVHLHPPEEACFRPALKCWTWRGHPESIPKLVETEVTP